MYHPPLNAHRIPAIVKQRMPAGATYLGEDAFHYYWIEPHMGLGGIMDFVHKMSKNIWRITPVSLVMRAVAPKLEKQIYQKVAPHILPAAAAVGVGVAAVHFAPAIWSAVAPKLAAAGNIISQGFGMLTGKGGGGAAYGSDPKDQGPFLPATGSTTAETATKMLSLGGKFMQLLGQLPQNKQQELIQAATPEQIAYMEQTGQVPYELRHIIDQLAQQSYAAQGATGAASLYNPFGIPDAPVKEAGMFGEMNPMMLGLLIGVPLLFHVMSGKK